MKTPYLLEVGEDLSSDGLSLFRPLDICTTYIPSPVSFQLDSVGTSKTSDVIGILSHSFWRYGRGSRARQLTWVKMERDKLKVICQENVMSIHSFPNLNKLNQKRASTDTESDFNKSLEQAGKSN